MEERVFGREVLWCWREVLLASVVGQVVWWLRLASRQKSVNGKEELGESFGRDRTGDQSLSCT